MELRDIEKYDYRTKNIYVETKIKNDIEFYSPGAHILHHDLSHNLVKLRGILRNYDQINKERMKKQK